MEVLEWYAGTRAIIRDAVSPANPRGFKAESASRGVAHVVSDVSVLCPRSVVSLDNAPGPTEAHVQRGYRTRRASRPAHGATSLLSRIRDPVLAACASVAS